MQNILSTSVVLSPQDAKKMLSHNDWLQYQHDPFNLALVLTACSENVAVKLENYPLKDLFSYWSTSMQNCKVDIIGNFRYASTGNCVTGLKTVDGSVYDCTQLYNCVRPFGPRIVPEDNIICDAYICSNDIRLQLNKI